MKLLFGFVVFASAVISGTCRLVGIPTVPFTESLHGGSYSLKNIHSIIVDIRYASHSDSNGLTLIPPTLSQFASTFSSDLSSTLNVKAPVILGIVPLPGSIFLTVGDTKEFTDAAGRPTSEGYKISVSALGITITGASPLGVWWGTRTVLQQGVLGKDMKIPYGQGTDSPGWGERGMMLDAGRHYYPPSFLIEMCSYLSYHKQNVFHLHLSDNLYNNPNWTREHSEETYAAFRLNSPSPALDGLSNRPNESYYQSDFERIQQECAGRGVTIIPEIEAPGHAMVINDWKPELALPDFSMLNISHPDTIPTMQAIWGTFLPWMQCKVVSIGADEYNSSLRDDYNYFVNEMNDYITGKDKSMRIWGTFPPIANESNINTSVSIQHWEFFDDNPYYQYILNNYSVLNSDDAFYLVGKWSGSYPQIINITRVFHGAPDNTAYAPYIFDTHNSSNNPPKNNPYVLGNVMALWNDYGPNATTVQEAYWSVRDGLPALADKMWGGDLELSEYETIFPLLHPSIPGQNLDQSIPSKIDVIFNFASAKTLGNRLMDTSGNNYDGTLHDCKISPGGVIEFKSGESYISTPLGSKGRNYTLSVSVNPTSAAPGSLFSGPDSSFLHGDGSISNITLVSGGNTYSLNYSLPINKWTSISLIGRDNRTFLSVGSEEMEFNTRLGINGASFVWAPIAVEAPLAKIGGGGFVGQMKDIILKGTA
ncbi:hypothetical protein B7463_g6828, partial [Scytalidium lignicola]